jgi:hypothetical protein
MIEKEPLSGPEEIVQKLVDGLEISEGINYEFYERGSWYKQYGNTSDPDGEYEVRLSQESIDNANKAKQSLWELGDKHPELLGQILTSLLNKQLPPFESHYLISRTETGFQTVTPEPSEEHGWIWVSGPESRKIIEATVLGFGLKAIPHLKSMDSKISRSLIAKIKRQELGRKIKKIFIRP